MTDKGFNLFMNVLQDVYICPLRKKSTAPLLPDGTVKCPLVAAHRTPTEINKIDASANVSSLVIL